MITVCINGAAGRMGLSLVRTINGANNIRLLAALEHASHPDLGKDVGILAGLPQKIGVALTDKTDQRVHVLIDFSSPSGAMNALKYCLKNKSAFISGTTGLNKTQISNIKKAGRKIPCLLSPNMSPGAVMIFKLAPEIASALGPEYDVEIVEAHHRFKKDAPSGTALRLADNITAETGRKIPVHALRIGDVLGDHSVIFSTLGERIELTHRIHNRDIFSRGALKAVNFLVKAKPGIYTMFDVMNRKK